MYNSSFLAWWFWFLLDRFWPPKIDKVIKSGWFQSFQFYRSDLLVWWLWFLLDRFGLPKIEKVVKSGWFKSFQLYNPSFLAWWFWFLLDRFWLPKTDKVIKSGWFQSFQFYRSDLLIWWFWFNLDRFWLPKIEKSIPIWLIQIFSVLTLWFGDFDSFWTRLGCQSLKKYSNLVDSNHKIRIIAMTWFEPARFEYSFNRWQQYLSKRNQCYQTRRSEL